jgi:hypothetical protein
VDIERGKAYIAAKKLAGKPVITEQATVDFSTLIQKWICWLNEKLGDCTCESVAHGRMIFAALIGEALTITTADLERMYEASGWDPAKAEPDGENPTDQGWTLEAAAAYDQKIGVLGTAAAPKPGIVASAGVSVTDDDAQQVAMELFGGLSSGCEVQEANMAQFQEGKPWEVVLGSPVVGGHAIWKVKSALRVNALFVTWGCLQDASEAWEKSQVDEYLAFVPADWQSKLPAELVAAGIVDFAKLDSLVGQYGS